MPAPSCRRMILVRSDAFCFVSSQVKAQLSEAGDLLTKQVPEAGARVGQGTVEALKGATSNSEVGNPVKEALDALEQVRQRLTADKISPFKAS